jgi:hypothetical protein
VYDQDDAGIFVHSTWKNFFVFFLFMRLKCEISRWWWEGEEFHHIIYVNSIGLQRATDANRRRHESFAGLVGTREKERK